MRTWLGRLGTFLLFLLVGLCFAPSLIPPFLDRHYYEGPRSDHYDGARFFNPDPGPRAGAHGGPSHYANRWLRGGGDRARWPDHVPVHQTVPPRRVEGGEMLVTWIGHATVLVQTRGLNILTDPIWSERASPFASLGPKRVRAPGVRFDDLPKIDLILLSHNHYDHLDLPTLKRLWERDRPLIVTGLGNDAIVGQASVPAHAFDWGGVESIPCKWTRPPGIENRSLLIPCRVYVERSHHWSSRWGTDRNRALWSAFTVKLPDGNIFFAGDTGYGDGSWARQAAKHGPFRLAILPIGAYLPRDVMQPNHMDPDEAVQVFETLKPRQALGIHWGTFQLTFESIDDPPRRLAVARQARGIAAERFVTTEAGRTFAVP
jgi:L-ascorbate metabolism protein UlaG (beta-lactamase superfamily)